MGVHPDILHKVDAKYAERGVLPSLQETRKMRHQAAAREILKPGLRKAAIMSKHK